MATGLAIMGFGGGAIIAAPLSILLMSRLATARSNGVLPTFVTLGHVYCAFMPFGAFTVRVPAAGWTPDLSRAAPDAVARSAPAPANVHVDVAWRGAIHGRLLMAWSVAGVLGPVLVNYLREYQLAHGVPRTQVYSTTLYIMCGLLVVGLLCNLVVRKVDPHLHHHHDDPKKLDTVAMTLRLAISWLVVGLPLLWSVSKTLQNAMVLFG